jgi:hypothetical protein
MCKRAPLLKPFPAPTMQAHAHSLPGSAPSASGHLVRLLLFLLCSLQPILKYTVDSLHMLY